MAGGPEESEYVDYIYSLMHRRMRRRLAFIAVPALIGGLLLIVGLFPVGESIAVWIGLPSRSIVLMGGIFLGLSVTFITMNYLQTGFNTGIEFRDINRSLSTGTLHSAAPTLDFDAPEFQKLSQEISALRRDFRILKAAASEPSSKEAQDALAARLMDEVTQGVAGNLLKKIEARIEREMQEGAPLKAIERMFIDNLQRLQSETYALSRRGNLNLILGGITTISGLMLLAFFVLYDRTYPSDPTGFAMHFIPRVALVLMIQAFAYFFLKLYKSSLQEIKFFQNECTNIQQKYVALLSAVELKSPEARKEVIGTIARTDRNSLGNSADSADRERENSDRANLFELAKQAITSLGSRSS